jgi:DNA-binding response OmpR family regulator
MFGIPGDKSHVLVIEDDPATETLIGELLVTAGYVCAMARDSQTAWSAINEQTPDLIISNIELGDGSGLDLCRQFRQRDELSGVPVLFVSGTDAGDIVRRSHEAGGTYYLRKPFDPAVLLDLVDKALWMPSQTVRHVDAPTSTSDGSRKAHVPFGGPVIRPTA